MLRYSPIARRDWKSKYRLRIHQVLAALSRRGQTMPNAFGIGPQENEYKSVSIRMIENPLLIFSLFPFPRSSNRTPRRCAPSCSSSWRARAACRSKASAPSRARPVPSGRGSSPSTWRRTPPSRTCQRRTPASTGSTCPCTTRTSWCTTNWRRPSKKRAALPWNKKAGWFVLEQQNWLFL